MDSREHLLGVCTTTAIEGGYVSKENLRNGVTAVDASHRFDRGNSREHREET